MTREEIKKLKNEIKLPNSQTEDRIMVYAKAEDLTVIRGKRKYIVKAGETGVFSSTKNYIKPNQ